MDIPEEWLENARVKAVKALKAAGLAYDIRKIDGKWQLVPLAAVL